LLLAISLAGATSPAGAEIGAAASLFSDATFRGYSISDGRPAAVLDLSYDDPSGAYAGLSGSVVTGSSELVRPLSVQLNGGYARRLSHGLTLDVGAVASIYSHYSSTAPGRGYAEVYAGLSGKALSARLSFSPDYYLSDGATVYGEANGNIGLGYRFRLDGHVGMLALLDQRSSGYRAPVDWRLGIVRELGPVAVEVAWVGHDRAPRPFGSRLLRARRDHNALIFSVTTAL
jgi:uncharacterized protein (TIGR02001 family)